MTMQKFEFSDELIREETLWGEEMHTEPHKNRFSSKISEETNKSELTKTAREPLES